MNLKQELFIDTLACLALVLPTLVVGWIWVLMVILPNAIFGLCCFIYMRLGEGS